MPTRSDIAIVLTLAALAILEPTVFGSVEAPAAVAAPLTVLAVLPLLLRRRAPGPVGAAVLSVVAVLEIVTPAPATGMTAFLAMLLSVGTITALTGLREAVPWAVATLALLGLTVAADRGADAGDFVYASTMWLLAASFGRGLRARQLRAEHAERGALVAVEAERARLARELHDVVAHGLSVIHVQARVAAQLMDRDPAGARGALAAVEGVAHDALGDMRRMLALLRVDGAGETGPQLGLDGLPALVTRTRAAGVPVDLSVEGAPVPLPPGLDLAAYRIVQEALTNVLKHAGPVVTRVRVAFAADHLALEVVNAPGVRRAQRPAEPGHGLVGMRERATLFGGDLETRPEPDGSFAVRARLPLEAA